MAKNVKPPLCRYCGKPIGKKTTTQWFGINPDSEGSIRTELSIQKPATKADVQRLTNLQVVAVRRSTDKTFIDVAYLWDGVSYLSDYFCNTDHAVQFAFVHARHGAATQSYVDAEALRYAESPEGRADTAKREEEKRAREARDAQFNR